MAQIIVEPFEIAYGGAAPSLTIDRGSGGANLVSLHPREIWSDTGVVAGPASIDIDLGAVRAWDTIALVNVTMGVDAKWSMTCGVAAYGETVVQNQLPIVLPSEDEVSLNGPALFHSPGGFNSRYIRVFVIPTGAPLSIGRIIVGKSWQPTYPREQGAGRVPVDSGVRVELADGGIAGVPGVLVPGFRWVFGDLDPADLRKLWAIHRRRRTTEPLLLVEETTDTKAEEVHYCTLVDLEGYERRDQSKSRWALSVRDWK